MDDVRRRDVVVALLSPVQNDRIAHCQLPAFQLLPDTTTSEPDPEYRARALMTKKKFLCATLTVLARSDCRHPLRRDLAISSSVSIWSHHRRPSSAQTVTQGRANLLVTQLESRGHCIPYAQEMKAAVLHGLQHISSGLISQWRGIETMRVGMASSRKTRSLVFACCMGKRICSPHPFAPERRMEAKIMEDVTDLW